MILFFYALILLSVIGLLVFALYDQAPIIGGHAVDGWEWWRALPVQSEVVAPLGALIERPELAGSVAGMWDPWGAAGALVLFVILLSLAIRYLPRYIAGDL